MRVSLEMPDPDPFSSTKPAETVLVVDDDVRILALTVEMLRVAGYRVLKTNVASEAVLIFERNAAEIDLVLSDVQMPGLTGPELACRLRQRDPDLPVVFMTACTEDGAPPGALQKPFKMADLWSKISDALHGELATTLPPGEGASQTTAFPQTAVDVIGYGTGDRGRISNQIPLTPAGRVR